MSSDDFNFDEMAKLAKEDPKAFEQKRLELIRNFLQSAGEDRKRKLEGLQFKIDMIRRKAKTPLQATIEISKLMHDSFVELRELLLTTKSLIEDYQQGKPLRAIENSATIKSVDNVISINQPVKAVQSNED